MNASRASWLSHLRAAIAEDFMLQETISEPGKETGEGSLRKEESSDECTVGLLREGKC